MAAPYTLRRGARLLVVGGQPDANSSRLGRPFAGPGGKELQRWLTSAGLEWSEVSFTYSGLHLSSHVVEAAPERILALGQLAMAATGNEASFKAGRGAAYQTLQGPWGVATYDPDQIVRGGYQYRRVAVRDLIKCLQDNIIPPQRRLLVDPSIADIEEFKAALRQEMILAVDIETNLKTRQISHVGFSFDPLYGISIPFAQGRTNYWQTASEELMAWKLVRDICGHPCEKVLQNGLYDAQWLWDILRIPIMNYAHDTRLMHHHLWPEFPKSLGFMGSLWANEMSWKLLANHHEKRDDI